MTLERNKDGEVWDTDTGFVYDTDGTVKRPGVIGAAPLAQDAAAAAIAALDGEA